MAFSQAASELLLLQVHHAHDVGQRIARLIPGKRSLGGLTRTSGNRIHRTRSI